MPETVIGSFGAEVYSSKRMARLEGVIGERSTYGWVQALSLPTRELVEATIQVLYEEMLERKNAV